MKSVKNRSIKGSHAKRQAFLLLKETHPGLKQAAFQKFCRRVLGCGFRLGPSLPHRKPEQLALPLRERERQCASSPGTSLAPEGDGVAMPSMRRRIRQQT